MAEATEASTVETLDPSHPLAQLLADYAIPGEDGVLPEVTECFITDDGAVISSSEMLDEIAKMSMRCFDRDRIALDADNPHRAPNPLREVVEKSIEGSTQTKKELRDTEPDDGRSLHEIKVVPPPYPPEVLSAFLEVDETHSRCVFTKVTDSVGREYKIEAIQSEDGSDSDPNQQDDSQSDADIKEAKKRASIEIAEIRNFIEDCNGIFGFEGVLAKACMDHEAIGWGAIEVIRSRDGYARKINHLPATRLRVLKGWKGFVEIVSPTKFVYYQPFGDKVKVKDKEEPKGERPYNPRKDGDLEISKSGIEWSMIDRETGRQTSDFDKSANEILYVPKLHSNTIYYGLTDVIPALGHLLANVQIRDYLLQFFEHNTVPRYAIIIEGAKVADPVKRMIAEYFSTHVKGKPHKTLIIPVPALRGEVSVKFEKLDADQKEGSFLETRKDGAQGIMVAHGTPPAIIGIAEASELGSGKGLSQAEIYKDRIVSPSQRRWDACINRLFRLGLGVQSVALTHTPLDIRDREAEQRILTAYVDVGALSINQAKKRGQLGDAIPGGDRPFIKTQAGLIFVDEIPTMTSANLQALDDELEKIDAKGEVDLKAAKIKSDADLVRAKAQAKAKPLVKPPAKKPPGK
jgi:capsid portal protein